MAKVMSGLSAVPQTAREHLVQFYEDSDFLLEGVGRYLADGLGAGDAAVVIATQPHREYLEDQLIARGLNARSALEEGRYLSLDAAETLTQFFVGGTLQDRRFSEVIGSAFARATNGSGSRRVRVFGEMVALLWSQGDRAAAVALEGLWNDLGRRRPFSLFCAYPIKSFSAAADGAQFEEICSSHTRVVPAESFSNATSSEQRWRSIAALQQKAESLETEVARRRQVEEELQKKVDELAETDRRKDEFLAMLAHELRNPLSPIVTSLHLMRLRRDDPDMVNRSIEVIERQTQRMTRLVNDLLDVSRITRGTIALREETVGLKSLVERAIEQARPLLEERGHRLTLDLPAEPLSLRADPTRLEQALANLLINAAKYTDIGGHIRLTAQREASDLVISVRDNGIGLEPGLRERVFDLFVQSPGSATRTPGGLGIGLTVVRRLVHLHGGTVEAFSDGPGRGSDFVVRLPMRSVSPRAASLPASHLIEPPPSNRRRLLVVDDNADAAEGLSEILRGLGHHVSTVRDGIAAIDEARRLRPDMVFLDVAMPGMDGHEVARRLRAEVGLRSAVIVAMTGYGRESDRRLTKEAGFDHHLVKPLDITELEGLLKSSTHPLA